MADSPVAYVALLRGINVGGNNRVPMSGLKAMLADFGCSKPATLLQSGNAVFVDEHRKPAELEAALEAELTARLGLRIAFMVRTSTEWDEVVAANPFPAEVDSNPGHLFLTCFKTGLDPEEVTRISDANPGPELLQVRGRHLYTVYPEGMGRSTLRSKILAAGTARNWNTVLKIQAGLHALQS